MNGLTGDGEWNGIQYAEEEFREDAKVFDGVELIGNETIADRIWARPAVTVLGIDCLSVTGASLSVQASARALVNLRVPPGIDMTDATKLLTARLGEKAPWGARVAVEQVSQGQLFHVDTSSPSYAAMPKRCAC